MRAGYRMTLPVGSLQSWSAAFTGEYADAATRFLRPYIQRGTLVLDIGASLGLFTVPLAIEAQKAGAQVIAYEPVLANSAFVRRNAAANELASVVDVRDVGLGRESSELTMHIEGSGAGNAAVVSNLPDAEISRHDSQGGLTREQVVRISRLDEDLSVSGDSADRPRVSVIKLDVEGFEFEVFAGAQEVIAVSRPVIFSEFNQQWLDSRGVPRDALSSWAACNRYSIHDMSLRRTAWWRTAEEIAPTPIWSRTSADVLLLPE